ncbi:VOC family protein [Flavobacterium sinopsychrotolerans]|jgi:PhnB protein|uniref:PhnB protein n=1 Tax=Flavobacterium sinopsychrotolerans TaxID=604089 RepID=A0A1H8NNJ8_9FLAO|nr:VOC family protein [Flavobacterium sinopsychrotolerans]SEO31157.1 PhnB protein [Flavobacterium sinopsychrotolerans]
MVTVNTYIIFNGYCEEAFLFYKSIFGGEFSYFGRFRDMPTTDGKTCPPAEAEKIMHVSLPISKETAIMGSDSFESFGTETIYGNNFSLSINTESKEEADKLFNALSDGGKITMPMENTFWNAYFGTFTDKFGVNWMVNFDLVEGK